VTDACWCSLRQQFEPALSSQWPLTLVCSVHLQRAQPRHASRHGCALFHVCQYACCCTGSNCKQRSLRQLKQQGVGIQTHTL
jgi:hypothetical protein